MELHRLRPPKGSTKRSKRIARGIGSGKGKTAGRGTKGQKARRQINPDFEGGQTAIHRRLPVKRGFKNPNHLEFEVVNLDDLEKHFSAGETVTPESLQKKGLVKNRKSGVKVLAQGEIKKKLKVKAHRFSKSAADKIVAAGGEVTTQ